MAAFQITSSATLTFVPGFEIPNSDHQKGKMRTVLKVIVVNNEVLTIKHGEDPDLVRRVQITRGSGPNAGQIVREPASADANTGATVVRQDKDTTVISFGSAAAGTYHILIEF